jgi:hypothetical protein
LEAEEVFLPVFAEFALIRLIATLRCEKFNVKVGKSI